MDKLQINIFIIIIILMISYNAYAGDFRNISWGMTKIQVMASEKKAPVSYTGDIVLYLVNIGNKKVHLRYRFVENRLVDATYIIITKTINSYLTYKKYLTDKHGEPENNKDGGAISYKFTWNTKSTEISLTPTSQRRCLIKYSSKKMKQFEKDIKKKIALLNDQKLKFTF